ncbi:MAG: hypothetical protein KDA89_23155, partial [Planctomycetaceae bacterium]|nr:hypothetical protein [Planctomycetaceae bacterium]
DQKRVGIRFITQYLLRVDVEVVGARGDSISQLEILSGELIEQNGEAGIRVLVRNGTETPMEFHARTELISRDTGRRIRSPLWVPVRASQPPPDRYRNRILADTRLRLEGTLEEAVFAGDYDLQVEIIHQNQVMKTQAFPVTIRSGDFPAQDAGIVRVARDILVEPPHVELSVRKGGNRIQALTIRNESLQNVIAALQVLPHIGALNEMVTIRPDSVALRPGQQRRILLMLAARQDIEQHAYAFARVQIRPEVGEAIGTQDIPIALLTNSESKPEIRSAELTWFSDDGVSGFQLPIRNLGLKHLALNGKLALRDSFGRGIVLEDGFGRWVLPGGEDRLRFRLRETPPPGTYSVKLEIDLGDDQPPYAVEQVLELRDAPLRERVSDQPESTSVQ